jgi:activator of 2-hydroxyglutaryl-CoA dehydratase
MTCVVAVLVTGLVSFALGCGLAAALMRIAKPNSAEPTERTFPAERIVGIDVGSRTTKCAMLAVNSAV